MDNCSLDMNISGNSLEAAAVLRLMNDRADLSETILLTLNPGLEVNGISSGGKDVVFTREYHVILIEPPEPVPSGGSIELHISYSGTPIEEFGYPDVDPKNLRRPSKMGIFQVPKKYVFLSKNFVHLTPECGWYPRTGIPLGFRFPICRGR